MKVLLAAPMKGVQGGITRWTQHIMRFYESNELEDVKFELIDVGRDEFYVNMPLWKQVAKSTAFYWKIRRKFVKLIDDNKYDACYITTSASFSFIKDIVLLREAKKRGIKTIINFHFGRIPELSKKNNWEWKLIKMVLSLADRAVVLDKASYQTLRDKGYPNVEILPNPVAPVVSEIVKYNSALTRENGYVLFTGHVIKTKGVFELLEACSKIDGIRLKLVGLATENICKEIRNIYGEPEWLEICGEMPYEEVIKEMMKCDVFVLPTYTEGFPNVILEAMASGCAIVTTPVGAISEMLEDDEKGSYGVLVNPKNSSDLENAIASLLHDENKKNEMRNNVQLRVNERYNIETVFNNIVSICVSCTK